MSHIVDLPGSQISISVEHCPSAQLVESLTKEYKVYLSELAQHFNLVSLKIFTASGDYKKSITRISTELYRSKITPTEVHGVGVGMTLTSLLGETLYNHIVIDLNVGAPLFMDVDPIARGEAYHCLAHECAHVDVSYNAYLRCPDLYVYNPSTYALKELWSSAFRCWTEYEVTILCAEFGENPSKSYETVFVSKLAAIDSELDAIFAEWLIDGDFELLFSKSMATLIPLFVFASYCIGTHTGLRSQLGEQAKESLATHWFCHYFNKLCDLLPALHQSYELNTLTPASLDEICSTILDAAYEKGINIKPEKSEIWVLPFRIPA